MDASLRQPSPLFSFPCSFLLLSGGLRVVWVVGDALPRRCAEKAMEERSGDHDARLELWVELRGDEIGVCLVLQLDDLHALSSLVHANEFQARLFKVLDLGRVDFIPMPVPFVHRCTLVELGGDALVILEDRPPRAKTHCPAHVRLRALRHENNHRVLAVLREFFTVRVLPTEDIPGNLDDRNLHAQADTEEGLLLLTRVFARVDLPSYASVPKTSRH
mmetsp:Transcript_42137/g.86129  ORF Transcript_42137/g.86129 Transcript_42137/m.86129 type:complete len:218 (+) Transcript_42137:228-881(+)